MTGVIDIRDDVPLPDPTGVLSMSEADVVKGSASVLRERRYALLAGQAHLWVEGSGPFERAERVIDLLEAVLPVDIDSVL